MAKYVKCVDNSRNTDSLTVGKTYEWFYYSSTHISLVNDNGDVCTYLRHRFQDAEDERVTFASQEEFENAVMEVIMKRLCIHSHEAYIQVGDFGSSC